MKPATAIENAQQIGLWAAASAVKGAEGAAYVWARCAHYFATKALEGGARLTAAGWVSGGLEEAGRDLVRLGDEWLESDAPVGFELEPVPAPRYSVPLLGELVCSNPGCCGAQLCDDCRDLLDRYGEPGRERRS